MEKDHFADRLNSLFQQQLKQNGKPYTHREVAEGTHLAASTISRLRSGKETNPSFQTIYQICKFFNVPTSYFDLDREGVIEKQDGSFLNQVSHRSIGLDDEDKEIVAGMLEHILKLKGQKNQSEDDSPA